MIGARERRKCIRSRGRRRRRPSPANGWLLVCWMTLCHTLPKFVDSIGYQVTGAGRRASIGWEQFLPSLAESRSARPSLVHVNGHGHEL